MAHDDIRYDVRLESIDEGEEKDKYPIPYHPRPWQMELHKKLKRFSVIVMHRRAGKSVFVINHMLVSALRCTLPNPQYYFIAPTFAQSKRIAWRYLHTFTENIPGVIFNEADLKLTLPHNNAQIMLLSGENYHSLKGVYSNGTALDEYQDMSPLVWEEAVRPTLSDKQGWCIFAGTPRGNNHFKKIYDYAREGGNEEWFSALYKTGDTGVIPESELVSAKATMDPEIYAQEYECSFAAGLQGSYFAHELDKLQEAGNITRVPHDPSLLVSTAWDLGISDTTAIWFFQVVRGAPRIIDFYETSGKDLSEIVLDMRDKKYNFGEHLVPHDANTRDLKTGKTTQQVLYKLGLRKIRLIPVVKRKRISIDAARMLIKQCVFDVDKCKDGIKALYAYRKKWN